MATILQIPSHKECTMKALFVFNFNFLSAKFTAFSLGFFVAFSFCACSYESGEISDESNQSTALPQTLPNSNSSAHLPNPTLQNTTLQNSSSNSNSSATLPNGVAPLSNANLNENSSNLPLQNPPLQSQNAILPQIQVPQKLADTPKDSVIKVMDGTKRIRCYMPDVSSVYVVIGTCRTSWAKPARYDVFGRIAYKLDDTWFCLSAPESVAKTKTKSRDYLTLKPCVINDTKQQWKVKDDLFYSVDESYFVKDDGDYLYAASVRDSSLYTSKIDKSMSEWLNTIATPVNLSISMSLAWDYATKDGSERYFLYNNGSAKNTTELYYNLESGHIAQYDGYKNINCLYADLNGAQWNWAWWGACTDASAPSKAKNKAYWGFVRMSETQSLLINHQGAALRVTRTGIHWGKPYVATAEYLPKDNTNSPTSRFVIDTDTQEWLRFISANEGDNLPFCPAPDTQNALNLAQNAISNTNSTQNAVSSANQSTNSAWNSNKMPNSAPNSTQNLAQTPNLKLFPPLPQGFSLTEAWINRLLAITSTKDNTDFTQGVCGVCLLQSFQMLAELLENPQMPRTSGGYFFDTQAGANPFISFAARNSLLYQTLDDLVEWFPSYSAGEVATQQEIFEFNNNLALMSAVALLPQYDWRIVATSQEANDVARVVSALFNAPQGSAFLLSLRLGRSGQVGGHAMVALRLQNGVVLVPTNATMTLQEFRAFVAPMNTYAEFFARFAYFDFSVENLSLISAEGAYMNAFANVVSLNNCTGEGENRRGNRAMPQRAFVNQCANGRCFW